MRSWKLKSTPGNWMNDGINRRPRYISRFVISSAVCHFGHACVDKHASLCAWRSRRGCRCRSIMHQCRMSTKTESILIHIQIRRSSGSPKFICINHMNMPFCMFLCWNYQFPHMFFNFNEFLDKKTWARNIFFNCLEYIWQNTNSSYLGTYIAIK